MFFIFFILSVDFFREGLLTELFFHLNSFIDKAFNFFCISQLIELLWLLTEIESFCAASNISIFQICSGKFINSNFIVDSHLVLNFSFFEADKDLLLIISLMGKLIIVCNFFSKYQNIGSKHVFKAFWSFFDFRILKHFFDYKCRQNVQCLC